MNKNTKRLVGMLICLAMVLAVLPMAVSAAGTTIYVQPNENWLDANARFAAYFFGNGEVWLDCTDAGDGLYKVEVPEGYPNVIFCRMNPDTTENNWDNKWNQTADLTVPTDNKVKYVISGWGDGQWAAKSENPEPVAVVYYIRGEMNNWGTDNPMTDNGDGTYTLTMNVAAGTYQYKAGDAGWGSAIPAGMDNLTLTVSADGNVTFNLDVNAGTLTASGAYVVEGEGGEPEQPEQSAPADVVYYIRGEMNNWGTDNAMTDNGDGTYTLTMDVAAGTYQYKAGDADWNNAVPAGVDNLTLVVTADCAVTFVLDVNAGTLTATGDNVGEPEPVVYDYFVAGNAGLCGEEWNPGANQMTLNAQTGLYEITFSNIAAGAYEFKVTTGSWDTPAYGVDGGNCKVELTAASDVTITFNVETSEVKATVTAVVSDPDDSDTEVTDPTTEATTPDAEVTDPTTEATTPGTNPTEPSVDETPDTAIVTAIVPADWTNPCIWAWGANGNAFANWPGEAMTKDGDKFTAEVPSWVEYVIINNGAAEGAIQTVDIAVPAGEDVTVTVTTANDDGKYNATVNGVAPIVPPADYSGEYRVVGDADWLGAWDAANSVGLMTDIGDNVYEITFSNVAVGTYQFKITKNGSWDTNWGKDGPNSDNIELNVTVAGDVTVRFDAKISGISYKTAASDDFVHVWSDAAAGTSDMSLATVCVAMLVASAGLVCVVGKKKEF